MDTAEFAATLRAIAIATARAERARAYARAVGALDTAQSGRTTIRQSGDGDGKLPAAEATEKTEVPR